MNPILGRWTGLLAAVVLILATAITTTLVNQTFFVPAGPAADAPSQAESNPEATQPNFNPSAVEVPLNPVEIELDAAAPGESLPGGAEPVADSGDSEIDPGEDEEIEPHAVEPESESGKTEPGVAAADEGHSHASRPESSNPAPTLCVVADGNPDKLYWKFVEFHAQRAADIVGVHLDYSTHPDAADRAQAIEECALNGAPMILSTLADPQVIVPAMRAAAERGVRLASFGAGAEHADDAGSFIHVSMGDDAAARRAVDQFASAGVSGSILCLIPDDVEEVRRPICDQLRITYAGGSVKAHQLTAIDPGGQIEVLLAEAPETAGLLVLEADLLPHAINAMDNPGIAPVLGSIGEYPLSKLPFAQRDQIAFTVMDLARFEVLLTAAALRLMHTYHPNARFFEGAMVFEGLPNVHTGGSRGGHERPEVGGDPGQGSDGHDHGSGEDDAHDH